MRIDLSSTITVELIYKAKDGIFYKGTRNQQRTLITGRLNNHENLFRSISFKYINLYDKKKWTKFAVLTGLSRTKSAFECFDQFCDLYHQFKYHKGVSKRGDEQRVDFEFYDDFNTYYHVLQQRSIDYYDQFKRYPFLI